MKRRVGKSIYGASVQDREVLVRKVGFGRGCWALCVGRDSPHWVGQIGLADRARKATSVELKKQ